MSIAENKAVFLSYASQDAEAARRICEALRSGGVEVWFDADGGLEHGDEWDAKIRRQIKECVLFIPVISASTQARHEGYFRIEWDLAAERARGIASGVAFILPVVIDDTREPDALVPDRFRMVQWTRLRGGEVPADVQQRFLKLWSHRSGVLKQLSMAQGAGSSEGEAGRPRSAGPGESVASSVQAKAGRKVPAAAWIVAIVAALGVVAWLSQRGNAPSSGLNAGAVAGQSAVEKTTVPVSEARKLIAKAWVLLNKPELGRAELDAADTLCKQAAALDPTDADVWAAWSQADTWYIFYGFDDSAPRKKSASDKSAQAIQLDPKSFEARLAQIHYWVRSTWTTERLKGGEPERLLRALLLERPDEPRALLLQGVLLFFQDITQEDMSALQRLEKNAAFAVAATKEQAYQHALAGRWAKSEAPLERSIALLPYWDNLWLKILHALVWRGDLDLAGATLQRVPQAALQEDAGAGVAILVYRWLGRPRELLTFVDTLPRDWVRTGGLNCPKAFFAGLARLQLKQMEAARGDFRRALELVSKELTDEPNRPDLLSVKAHLLHYLGEQAEAEKTYRLAREVAAPPSELLVLFETADAALAELETRFERGPDLRLWHWQTTAASLRLDPAYEPLRRHPRFAALLARAEADPRKSPNAKTAATSTSPAPDQKSVAVLAFANLSDDKDNEYFSDGISEELLTVLQKIPGLKVAARTSAFSFKGKNVAAPEIGAKLGVAHLVEGSVQKSGGRVKITARLSRVATGEELWSRSFPPRELTDVFATQSEIAQAIVTELRGQLEGKAPASAEIVAQVNAAEIGGTRNVEAHQLFLRGRFSANQGTPESLLLAQTLLERAVALDQNFAHAWVALSNAGWLRQGYEPDQQKAAEGAALAQRAANRALALAPNFAPAHVARLNVQFFAYDWKGAGESLRRATELAPNDPGVMCGAMLLANTLGQTERAVDFGRQAAALDPVNPVVLGFCGFTLLGARRFAEAEAMFRRVAELNGQAPWGHSGVSVNFAAQGQFDEAAIAAAVVVGEWERLFVLALANWGQGKKVEADAALAGLAGRFGDVLAYQVADVHAFRGETDRAFEWLERAYRQHDTSLPWIKLDGFLANLRADPRWTVFLRKLGLADEQWK